MVNFFDFMMPMGANIDPAYTDRARSQGLMSAAAQIADMSAPGYNKPQATPLQLITHGFTAFGDGSNNAINNYYTNGMNQAKLTKANADGVRADLGAQYAKDWFGGGPNAQPTFSPPNPQAPAPVNQTTDMLKGFYQAGSKPVNNPGNLRAPGASSGFRQFDTPDAGMDALTADLTAKVTGKSPAMGSRAPTLRNIISVYSPPNENQTAALIQNAVKRTGLDPDQPLTEAQIPALREAILTQEQGGATAQKLMSGQAPSTPMSQAQAPASPAAIVDKSELKGRADQLYKLGVIQALAGDGGSSIINSSLMIDPMTSEMVGSKNLPAPVQIANDMRDARARGDFQRIKDLETLTKIYEKGVATNNTGTIAPINNYAPAVAEVVKPIEKAKEQGKIAANQEQTIKDDNKALERFNVVADSAMKTLAPIDPAKFGAVGGRTASWSADSEKQVLKASLQDMVGQMRILAKYPASGFSDADANRLEAIVGGQEDIQKDALQQIINNNIEKYKRFQQININGGAGPAAAGGQPAQYDRATSNGTKYRILP